MLKKETKDRITDFLLGHLSAEDAEALMKLMQDNPEVKQEYNIEKALVEDLRNLPIHQPTPVSKERFDRWLNGKIETQQLSTDGGKSGIINIWKYGIAASIVLAIGVFIGQEFLKKKQLVVSHQESKEVLLQLVSDQSTTGRIQGINRSKDMQELDPQVREALLSVLENDESTNVRLAALDALAVYISDPKIKSKLLQVLKEDSQPIIQISIINSLVRLKEPDTKATLEDLVDSQNLEDDVRDEAILGITRL